MEERIVTVKLYDPTMPPGHMREVLPHERDPDIRTAQYHKQLLAEQGGIETISAAENTKNQVKESRRRVFHRFSDLPVGGWHLDQL